MTQLLSEIRDVEARQRSGRWGPRLSLRARGPLACFTRPELKVERMSYPVMTPSAARGLLESVLWKPAIRWQVEEIHVLSEIRFTSFRRNEVNSKASFPSSAVIRSGGGMSPFYADEDRAQRNTVALADVDYIVHARFQLTPRAGDDDNIPKFVDIFQRRVMKGQCFQQPYFGCREFVAEIGPEPEGAQPIREDRDLGVMLFDIEFGEKGNRALFFEGRLESGVLRVPSRDEVLALQ